MVIEYKIKFQEDGVTVTQSVDLGTAKAKDEGGDGTEVPPDEGGDGTEVPPDEGGDGTEVPPDEGGDGTEVPPDEGGRDLGRGRVVAVVLGPLVIGNVGAARSGATNGKRESVKNPPVVAVPENPPVS